MESNSMAYRIRPTRNAAKEVRKAALQRIDKAIQALTVEADERAEGVHQARKRFGQNFLTDESVVESIVRAIGPAQDDRVIEIGPGLSALTRPLLERLSHLTAVEIDRDLAARLRKRLNSKPMSMKRTTCCMWH